MAGGPAEHLSLLKNPVTRIKNYRLYTIHKIPTLLTLDFTRVKQKVRPCNRAGRAASLAMAHAHHDPAPSRAFIVVVVCPGARRGTCSVRLCGG